MLALMAGHKQKVLKVCVVKAENTTGRVSEGHMSHPENW